MKILSIFNTFSSQVESDAQLQGYIDGLSSILMQRGVDQDVVLSSCLNTAPCRSHLMDLFDDNLFYSFIDELQPLPVTVNLTALKMTTLRGSYDAYLYVDSGVRLTEEVQIAQLVHNHKDNNAAMTSAVVNTDGGYYETLHWGEYVDDYRDIDKHFTHGIYKIPLGGAVNLHFQLFDRSIYESFNSRIYSDIFAGQASESVFTYICASLKKPFILTNDVKVDHLTGMDGASSGFSPAEWVRKGNNRLDHPFKIDSIFRVIREGAPFGLGYQTFSPEGVQPDRSKYDDNGFALTDDLMYYIRSNLFLNKNQFDYGAINHQLITL